MPWPASNPFATVSTGIVNLSFELNVRIHRQIAFPEPSLDADPEVAIFGDRHECSQTSKYRATAFLKPPQY